MTKIQIEAVREKMAVLKARYISNTPIKGQRKKEERSKKEMDEFKDWKKAGKPKE